MKFWPLTKKRKKYTLVENKNFAHYAVRLDEGPYKGVVYSYETVRLWENTGETATLHYDYTLHSTPDGFEANEEFENYIGDICVELLAEESTVKIPHV